MSTFIFVLAFKINSLKGSYEYFNTLYIYTEIPEINRQDLIDDF